jgi:DNA-directed RNA polymerase I, II, and III subunit RPABC5
MIIPVRCYTCGKIIADKYDYYNKRVADLKRKENKPSSHSILNMNVSNITKTVEGRVLDEMGFTRLCCRKIMLSHIDFV